MVYKIIKNYKSEENIIDVELAIKFIKDTFERKLAKKLNLVRVSAPIMVLKSTGLNDELNGIEKPVSFSIDSFEDEIQVVQSLAKWKRNALKEYNFSLHTGLYTDMNAIRKDEKLDNIHSLYVDQWDYEIVIDESDRNKNYLFKTVKKIYKVLLDVEKTIYNKYPNLKPNLAKKIKFISTRELDKMYPNLTRKEKEYEICKEFGSVFIFQIGWPLKDGLPHDGRAADYDDWELNGDILVFDEIIDAPLELSSMGIRVNKDSLLKQLKYKNELDKLKNKYIQDVMSGALPFTIGGGIGQSRLCMYYLKKAHIGEVQASIWPKEQIDLAKSNNIKLL